MNTTNTTRILQQLRGYESRNVTFMEPDGSWPIVWERAKGARVWDADGNEYLDLTAAFGVAAAGHGNPRVVKAGQRQMGKLLHAMGDVHPHALKAQLAQELSRITFERWSQRRGGIAVLQTGKTIFCNSGFEAVEAALKTAMLMTGRAGVIAFLGAYHGLGYGSLNVTHREHFRSRFRSQLGGFAHFVPFPGFGYVGADGRAVSAEKVTVERTAWSIRQLCRQHRIGAILVEPAQGRGGVRVPPPEFLPALRKLGDENGALLILDEVYTGFGRTGKWFACEHSGTIPDLICLGKALAGGFPLSACVGRADLMDEAWPPSTGEAIHTSTFLGHPVGCAMALAQIEEIETRGLVERSASLGERLLKQLRSASARTNSQTDARGLGLMAGLELHGANGAPASAEAMQIIKAMRQRGYLVLPEGEHGNVISFTPPLMIAEGPLRAAVKALGELIGSHPTRSRGRAGRAAVRA
ncbi:MAG TPA: aspartate aminotransferase family protein [Verrucomicrobiae bacterium]